MTNEKELPELPEGWRWANIPGRSRATAERVTEDERITVLGGEIFLSGYSDIAHSAPLAVLFAVLKANGVTL